MAMNLGSFASRVVATKVVATDGTGDFTDIQEAIDALPADGGVVYVKEGTYTIISSLTLNKNNIAIVGAGKATKIQTISNIAMISADTKSGLHIEKIWFYGAGSGNGSNVGISFLDVTDSRVVYCWIENCGSDGIQLNSGDANVVSYCDIYSNDTGVHLLGLEKNCAIVNNNIYTNRAYGIWVYYSANTIMGNQIYDNEYHGIYLQQASDCRVIGNRCVNNDFSETASYDGIHLVGSAGVSCDRNIIEGNHCEINDRYEINISNSDCNKNIVLGNNCYGWDHVGAINDSGTNTQLAHNIIS